MTDIQEIKETRVIHRNKRMPTFIIEFWHQDNYGEDMNQHILKRMFAGVIEHVQSGDRVMFQQISEMLKFMEEHRVTGLGKNMI